MVLAPICTIGSFWETYGDLICLVRFPPFYKGNKFWDFLFVFLHIRHLKGAYTKRKEFTPCGSKFFPFRVGPFSEGRQMVLTELPLLTVYPNPEFLIPMYFFFQRRLWHLYPQHPYQVSCYAEVLLLFPCQRWKGTNSFCTDIVNVCITSSCLHLGMQFFSNMVPKWYHDSDLFFQGWKTCQP